MKTFAELPVGAAFKDKSGMILIKKNHYIAVSPGGYGFMIASDTEVFDD